MTDRSFLCADLRRPAELQRLRADWRQTGCLRIAPILDPDAAEELLGAFREEHFEPRVHPADPPIGFRYVYWQHNYVPDADCTHVKCQFGRWLFGPFRQWLTDLTGMPLAPPDDRQVASTLYLKGSYLDSHNDFDGQRQIAYIFGLTPEAIPRAEGGNLEFLEKSGDSIVVREHRPAGWNTLDIFDVRTQTESHRVPILRSHRERRAVTGWMLAPRQ